MPNYELFARTSEKIIISDLTEFNIVAMFIYIVYMYMYTYVYI